MTASRSLLIKCLEYTFASGHCLYGSFSLECSSLCLYVMVWVRNATHGLTHVNTWCLIGAAVGERKPCWKYTTRVKFITSPHFQFSLCSVLVIEDIISQHPIPTTCCYTFPTITDSSFGTISLNTFSRSYSWSQSFVIATEKWLT